MKINATENVYNPDNTVKTVRLFELDIPADEIRRMAQSVTKAPENEITINLSGLSFSETGQVIEKLLAEDSLAKARSEKMIARAHSDPIKIWKHYDNAFAAYESAIRERDEKPAQSVTEAPEEKFLCPNCKKEWDIKNYTACECGASVKTTPAVEDSLAKARRLRAMYGSSSTHDAYESAIRERDEKLAQSMTVEEWSRWWNEWDERKRFPPTFIDFLRQKIKERNDADKAGK